MYSSFAAEVALAHPGHGIGESFLAWLAHVCTSPDHLLGFVVAAALGAAIVRFGRRGRSDR
jgi:hydrogenase/urease accessory protein HupE